MAAPVQAIGGHESAFQQTMSADSLTRIGRITGLHGAGRSFRGAQKALVDVEREGSGRADKYFEILFNGGRIPREPSHQQEKKKIVCHLFIR
jgi:hypothetical protein